MSTALTICQAIIDDLQANIAELSPSIVDTHKLTPYSLESMKRDGGKHLAVWLSPQEPSVRLAGGVETGVHQHEHHYIILYWEPTPEGEIEIADEDAAEQAFLLSDSIMARIYQDDFQNVGSAAGGWRCWFESETAYIGGIKGVRALVFTLTIQVQQGFA